MKIPKETHAKQNLPLLDRNHISGENSITY